MVDGWMDDNNKLLCLESFAKNKKNKKNVNLGRARSLQVNLISFLSLAPCVCVSSFSFIFTDDHLLLLL